MGDNGHHRHHKRGHGSHSSHPEAHGAQNVKPDEHEGRHPARYDDQDGRTAAAFDLDQRTLAHPKPEVSALTQARLQEIGLLLKQNPLTDKGSPIPGELIAALQGLKAAKRRDSQQRKGSGLGTRKRSDSRKASTGSKRDGRRSSSLKSGTSSPGEPDDVPVVAVAAPVQPVLPHVKVPFASSTPAPVNAEAEKAAKAALSGKQSRVAQLIVHKSRKFIPPALLTKMLKTSMRFVPGVNSTPNVTGSHRDPPYLFKVPGREVPTLDDILKEKELAGCTKPGVSKVVSAATDSDGSTTESTVPNKPLIDLSWPTDASQLLIRSHHNMLVAFLNFYNRKARAEAAGRPEVEYDPSLSISCSLSCGKSPYPPMSQDYQPLTTDSSNLYTPLGQSSGFMPHMPGGHFLPPGFSHNTMHGVPTDKYTPDPDYKGPQPFFPDAKTMLRVPQGMVPGYMDANGHFHPASMGDALPPDVTLGYLDGNGKYHELVTMDEGLANGMIPIRNANQSVPFRGVSLDEGGDPNGLHAGLSASAFGAMPNMWPEEPPLPDLPFAPKPPGSVYPSRDGDEHPEFRLGDPSKHQSVSAFVGHGHTAAKKNTWEDVYELAPDGVKYRKKRKKKKREGTGLDDPDLWMTADDEEPEDENSFPQYDAQGNLLYDADGKPLLGPRQFDEDGNPILGAPKYDEEGKLMFDESGKLLREAPVFDENGKFVPPPKMTEDEEAQLLSRFDGKELTPAELLRLKVERGSKLNPDEIEQLLKDREREASIPGIIDENGVFRPLAEGEPYPPGTEPGFLDSKGTYHRVYLDSNAPSKSAVYVDTAGNVHKTEHIEAGGRPGYINKHGDFKELKEGETVPEGAPGEFIGGFVDAKGNFQAAHHLKAGDRVGFVNEDGAFIPLLPGEVPPEGLDVGHQDANGEFHAADKVPEDAKVGYMGEDGAFHELSPGQEVPSDGVYGYQEEDGTFHVSAKNTHGQPVFMDEHGAFIKVKEPMAPAGGRKGSDKPGTGYDKAGTGYEKAGTGPDKLGTGPDKRGTGSDKPGTGRDKVKGPGDRTHGGAPGQEGKSYVEDPDEIVEVEIYDEDDLDENGKPKMKVVLRHRASVGAPADARLIEGGGKVWIEGNEEVTEVPYYDKNDLDENGKPKLKRMRVRRLLASAHPSETAILRSKHALGRQHRGSTGPTDADLLDDEADLRDVPLTEEERLRLMEFQRHISVQCELEFVEGSLDLGEVFRKSFRIYSHGGSIDVDPNSLPPPVMVTGEGTTTEDLAQAEVKATTTKPANQRKKTSVPKPKSPPK